MKRKKSIIALMIAVVIMCLCTSTAFSASDVESQLQQKMYDLRDLCEEAHFAYGVGYSIRKPGIPGSQSKPRYLACSDTTKLKKAWEDACPMVQGYFNSYMFPYDGDINIETATEKYNALYEELYKIVIDRSELESLVAFCEKESNDDNYYEAQLWKEFQDEITQSKDLLSDESITDMRVNTAYYELMYQFNLICTSNQVAGDVNNDGKMTIFDATYIQFFIAGNKTINSSQMLVTGNYKLDGLSVFTATTIQRKCAKVIDMYEPVRLEMMIDDLEKSNPESEEFELSSWTNNFVYYYRTE